MVAALIRPHPLTAHDQQQLAFPPGYSIADMATIFWPDAAVQRHVIAFVGDVRIPRDRWALIRPKEGATVRLALTCFEGGGNGGGKNMLGMIAMIAISIVAMPAAMAIAGTTAATAGIGTYALAAGITLAGALAVNALFKPPPIDVGTPSSNPADAPTYSITGQANQATPYGPMLRVYGRHKIFPRLAAVPFSTTEGPHQFLYMLLDCGYGPLQIDDLRIGDTPILKYRDVLYKVHPSWKKGDALTYYRNDTTYEQMNLTLGTEVAEVRLTAADASGIVLDFALPKGLVAFDDRGGRGAHAVSFDAYVRKVGTATWEHVRKYPVYVSRSTTPAPENELNIGAFLTYAWPNDEFIPGGSTQVRLNYNGVAIGDHIWIASQHLATVTSVAPAPAPYVGRIVEFTPATPWDYDAPVQSPILRPTGVTPPVIIITDATPAPILFSLTVDVPVGAWEVQVIRRSAESTSDRIFDQLVWTTIRSLADRPPVAVQAAHTLIELKIRASEQLAGVLQDVNCIATSILPVWVPAVAEYLSLPGVAGAFANTPDSAAISITGNPEIIVCAAATDWTHASVFQRLVNKGTATAATCAYRFYINPTTGFLHISVSDGTTFFGSNSTAAPPVADGASAWLKANLVLNNGAGSRVANFYYSLQSPTTNPASVVWTKLGATVTTAGVATLADTANALAIGATSDGSGLFAGKIYRAQVFNGIDGTLVADFYPGDAALGAGSVVSSTTGETWGILGSAAIGGTPAHWAEQATRNPAWAYADVLRGSAAIRPLPDSRIDYADSLLHWAAYCDAMVPNGVGGAAEARVRFDHVIDYQTTTLALLQSIAAAGRATPAVRDGKHGVIIDEEQAVPVQLFTPRNSWGFASRRSYLTEPHALRVKFIDPQNGWQEGNLLIYASGRDQNNSTTFEDLKLFGVTRYTQATRDGRYMKAQALLRREEFTINCDIENLIATRGDLVLVQHDVLRVGGDSARVAAFSGDSVQLSDPFGTLPAGSYGVRIRLANGVITAPIPATPIAPDTFNLSAVPVPAPAPGDLLVWGFLETEAGEYLVKQIAPGDELTAQLTLAEIARAVYDADTGEIPPYTPPAGGRPTPGPGPAVINLRIEQRDMTIGREPYADLILAWNQPQPGGYPKYRVLQIADDGVATQIGETHLTRFELEKSLRLLDLGVTTTPRHYAVIGIDQIGLQSESAVVTFTPRDPLFVPGDAQYLSSNVHDKTTTLTWTAPTDAAMPGNAQVMYFEVRFHPPGDPTWGTASRIVELVPWNVTAITVPSRNGAYLVKAITASKIESVNPAITATAVEDLVIQDIFATHEFAPGWVGFFDRCELDDDGGLRLTTEPNGTYSPVGVFYPDDQETFAELVQCRAFSTVAASGISNAGLMSEWVPLAVARPLADVKRTDWGATVWVAARPDISDVMADWVPLAAADPLDPLDPIFDSPDWRPMIHGEYICREMRFALVLESFTPNVTPRVTQAAVHIDFPEREERHADIAVPIAGLNFLFDRSFVAAPAVAIDLQNAAVGDYVDRSPADTEGFSVFVRNSAGAAKAGVIDISAFGIGRTF